MDQKTFPTYEPETDYARKFHNSVWGLAKREPEISIITHTTIDPDIVSHQNCMDTNRFQNACVYVSYQDENLQTWLLVTVNHPRVRESASILTPGGRRDYDFGLFYTAIKELSEEAYLFPKDILSISSNAKVAYISSTNFKGFRNKTEVDSQIHAYHIDLGPLSHERIKTLNSLVKPGSDVAIAGFVNIQNNIITNKRDISLHNLGCNNIIPVNEAVLSVIYQVFVNPKTALIYHDFREIYSQIGMLPNHKIIYLLKKYNEIKVSPPNFRVIFYI